MEFYPPMDWTRHMLHAAAISGNRSEVERLIAEGADVNENLNLDMNGRQDVAGTPLHVAICFCCRDDPGSRHDEVVKVLLTAGADIRLSRKWEGTPFHDAARKGLIHMAEILLSHGADVNSKEDAQGRTPLHIAAANDRLKMVDYLISKGAEINAVADTCIDPYAAIKIPKDIGMTALHLAAREGHVAVVRRLIDAGTALDVRVGVASQDRSGLSAVDLAVQSKRENDARFDQIIALLSSEVSQ